MNVGDTIRSLPQLWSLPIGTVVTYRNHGYSREYDGFYGVTNGAFVYPSNLIGCPIASLGDEGDAFETVEKFMDFLVTLSLGSAAVSSVAGADVALTRMGVNLTRRPLRLGMYVHRYDENLWGRIPDGSILLHGNPLVAERHTLYSKNYYDVTRITGLRSVMTDWGVFQVVAFPGGTTLEEWAPARDRETEQREIHAVRRAAWVNGTQEKAARSWCGTFEAVMSRVAIDSTILAEVTETGEGLPSYGAVLTMEQVAALPVGSIVMFPGIQWNWMIRTDVTPHGASRTDHLLGPNSGRHGGNNTLVYRPGCDEPVVIERKVLDYLPTGSIIRTGTNQTWSTKNTAGEWVIMAETATHPAGTTLAPDRFAEGCRITLFSIPGVMGPQIAEGSVVASHALMEVAPVGSQVKQNGNFWEKTEAGWRDRGVLPHGTRQGTTYRSNQFGLSDTLQWKRWGQEAPVEAAVEEPGLVTNPRVGQPVESHDAMRAVGIGSRITQRGMLWVKDAGDHWSQDPEGNGRGVAGTSARFVLSDEFVWERIVTTDPERPYGRSITANLASSAPAGTRIRNTRNNRVYEKTEGTRWDQITGDRSRNLHSPATDRFVWFDPTLPLPTETGD